VHKMLVAEVNKSCRCEQKKSWTKLLRRFRSQSKLRKLSCSGVEINYERLHIYWLSKELENTVA